MDALNARQVRALTEALAGAKAGREAAPRVAITLDRERATADLTGLLRLFPGTVGVPPLRHHNEDLRELVPFFLGKLSQQGRVSCSPAAMQLLLRHTWPGNATQLWQVLKQVVQHRRTGQIMPRDLPPECWTVSRRVLSPLESIERDAIVQCLLDNGGQQDPRGPRARHVPCDDLPPHPRVRHRHPGRLAADQPGGAADDMSGPLISSPAPRSAIRAPARSRVGRCSRRRG